MTKHSYIIEYYHIGRFVKVSAFDTATLTEVSIVGDPKATKKALATLAVRKLEQRLKKLKSR